MIHNTTLIRSATALALAAALCACATPPPEPAASASSVDTHAAVIFTSCGKPEWPAAARAAQRTGTVTLMFDIDADGKMMGSNIARSSGHSDLDEAARAGIAKCTFNPGTLNGKPVRSEMKVQYVWTLK